MQKSSLYGLKGELQLSIKKDQLDGSGLPTKHPVILKVLSDKIGCLEVNSGNSICPRTLHKWWKIVWIELTLDPIKVAGFWKKIINKRDAVFQQLLSMPKSISEECALMGKKC